MVISDEAIPISLSLECAVDLGPLLEPYSALARPQHLGFQARTQFARRYFLAADAYISWLRMRIPERK